MIHTEKRNVWDNWKNNEQDRFAYVFHFDQAYHSQIFKVDDHLCSFALLPIRTQTRGPAPTTNSEDIIDETIYYFKANIFFRTYEIKVMIYFLLWIFERFLRKWNIILSIVIFNAMFFQFSEWSWSTAHLHYVIYYRMFEKASEMR